MICFLVFFLMTIVSGKIPPYRSIHSLVAGATRSGKSYGEVWEVLAAALSDSTFGRVATIVIDPHRFSLAWSAFVQLIAHGFQSRILFDQLSHFESTLGYEFLRPSSATNPLERRTENNLRRNHLGSLLIYRRNAALAQSPLTEEYVNYAIDFLIYRANPLPASYLQYAFKPHHKNFGVLLQGCTDPDVRFIFEQIAAGQIKRGTYAAAARLIDAVCTSPVFEARCGEAFDLHQFLDKGGILLVEGGGTIGSDAQRIIMGSIVLQVIDYVRTRPRPFPRVQLIVDEAVNAGLFQGDAERLILAEGAKMGISVTCLVQNPNSFASKAILDDVLSNTLLHKWYFQANDAAAGIAAADLGDSSYREQVKNLATGERIVKRRIGNRTQIVRERVPVLPDLFAFPGLADKKAEMALKQIRTRSEYQSQSCESTLIAGENEKSTSSNLPRSTPSSESTSKDVSPAKRLVTKRSKSSSGKKNSDESEP